MKNERCYASPLDGCSGKLSGEHIVSEGVLKIVAEGKTVNFDGLNKGNLDGVNPKSKRVQRRVLCTTHNSGLSSLDQLGIRFFSAIKSASENVLSNKHIHTTSPPISGAAVERWVLKTACNLISSGETGPDTAIPQEWLNRVFKKTGWPKGAGLYLLLDSMSEIAVKSTAYSMETLYIEDKVGALRVTWGGVVFVVVFDSPGANIRNLGRTIYRPNGFAFKSNETGIRHDVNFIWFETSTAFGESGGFLTLNLDTHTLKVDKSHLTRG